MANPLRKLLNALTGRKTTRAETKPRLRSCLHLKMEIEDLWFDHGPEMVYTCDIDNREVGRNARAVPGIYIPGPYYSLGVICPIEHKCPIMNQ